MKKLLSPFILCFVILGCKKDNPPPHFEVLTIDEISTLDCDPEEENCAYISIHIPWASNSGSRNKAINQNIEKHVLNLIDYQEESMPNNLESFSLTFIQNYEISAAEFPEYNIPWEANVEGRVLTNNPEIISIEFTLSLFTGGAHGYTSKSFLNIHPATGEKLAPDDIFTPEFKDYAEEIFRKKHEIPHHESINSTGYFFDDDRFQLPQNIGFLRNKIILRYNVYEVASYSEGGIQIEIPKEEALEYLKI
ncbi:DUF3298 and DUF4163 domain-containing protein [soil metagenome]